jgi:uncharacterized membrane protein YbhN (UPF0104 family)
MKRSGSFVSKLVRLAISAALLGWVAWETDWARFGQAFAALRLELWLGALGLFVLMQVASALRWQILARALGFERSLKELAGFYFIGSYFNLVLPTSVGGDVVRAFYLCGGTNGRMPAFLSVFLDRLSGLLVLLVLACMAVLLSPVPLEAWIPWSVWGMTASAALGILVLPLAARWFRLGAYRVQQIETAMSLLRRPRVFLGTTLLSAFVQAGNVVIVWMIGLAIQADVPASFYWILVPMVSLLTMLPISINGTGVREVSMVVLLAPLGISRGLAVSLSLLWFAVFATFSLAGGVVYLFGRFPKPASRAGVSAEVADGSLDRHPDQGRTGQSRPAA